MAQYKVPQDVEADDKLIGPFSFRQFVYLLIAAGCIALTVGIFQLFPLLAIIPVLPAIFFIILALPLKKDQPMETYLAALVSYYLKPRNRIWMPGQRESTILITAPKIVEDVRTRDISGEEATHRLSFLADIVDTEGYAIKGATNNSMREDLVAEANAADDMFDNYQSNVLARAVDQNKIDRHEEVIREMRETIERNDTALTDEAVVKGHGTELHPQDSRVMKEGEANIVREPEVESSIVSVEMPEASKKPVTKPVNNSIMELANNPDFSVATIAKEANRINRKEAGEVFISLH